MNKLFTHSILTLWLLTVLPLLVLAQTDARYADKIGEIDAYIQKTQKDWRVPGLAVAIVKDDKVIFSKGYGVRETGKPERVDENTLFVIASNSKAFTTASLAVLVDEGKLKWDDKAIDYLPEFQMPDAYVTRELTIRDLVSHRSGLGTFSGDLLWYETNRTSDDVLRRVRFLKPVNSFRAAYGYQNLMFIAAGRIIEKVSGKTWGEFVTTRILTPLGMNNTKTTIRDFKPGDNIASPHNELNGKLRVVHYGNIDAAAAAAGLNSSAADVAKWLRLQLAKGKFDGKQIFSPTQSWAMQQQNLAIPISEAGAKFNPTRHFYGYGLGWFLNDYNGRKTISHGGGLDGMISQTAFMPEENLGLVVLTNSETPVNTILQNKIFDVMLGAPTRDWSAELLDRTNKGRVAAAEEDQKVVAARVANTKPALPLVNYTGTYSDDLYGDGVVTEENGRLVLRLAQSPNLIADPEHWHYDTFQIRWRDSVAYAFGRGFVTFTIDETGKPTEFKINQPNNDFWFYELNLQRKQKVIGS